MKFNLEKLKDTRFSLPKILKELKEDKKLSQKLTKIVKDYKYKPDRALYHLVYPKARTRCLSPICNKITTYRRNGDFWGYNKYCDNKCCQRDPNYQKQVKASYKSNPRNKTVYKRIQRTWEKNYGTKNLFDVPEIKEKRLQTYIDRYGETHPWKNKKIMEARDKTWEDKYGGRPMSSKTVRAKVKETTRRKYGVDCVFQSEEIKEKARATNRKNFGSDYPMQDEEHRKEKIKACRKKRGVDNPMQDPRVREKNRETTLKRYGVENAFQAERFKEKSKRTMLRRYGAEHNMQVPEFFEANQNSRHKRHKIEVKGKIFSYQGYEHYALKILVNQLGIPVDHLTTRPKHQHKVWWGRAKEDPKSKGHRYYTDIRIKHRGKDISIEVKCLYTLGFYNLQEFLGVKAKAKAAYDAGVDLRVWVVDPKTKHITRIRDFHKLTWKALHDKFLLSDKS
jgi:hypothetical protein